MNKIINKALFLLITVLFFSICISAQYSSGRILPNGLNVIFYAEHTVNDKKVNQAQPDKRYFETTNVNTISRTYLDLHNSRFYGYDVEIEKTNEPEKYKVTLKTLSENVQKNIKSQYSPYPNLEYKPIITSPISKIVGDGDTITINVSEVPESKEKFIEYIKVTKDYKPFGNYFPEKNDSPAKDYSLEDVELKLSNFDVYLNGRKRITKIGGGVSGSLVWVNFPDGIDKGRFIFSVIPRPGYDFQKVGTLKDYTIEFNFNGVNYQLVSSIPIISTQKAWNLWILYDPNYKSEHFNQFEIGAADDAKYLFKK